MKNILFILLVGFLASCASSNMSNPDLNIHSLNELKSLDSLENNEEIIIQDEVLQDPDTLRREILVNEMKIIPHDEDRIKRFQNDIKLIEDHEKKTQLQVTDRTSTNTVSDGNRGWIAYSVAEEMKVEKNYSVKVRITKKNGQSKAQLILGNDDAINNPEYPSIAVIEDVRVSGEMSAELRGDSDVFKIVSLSTPTQNIDDESYTEWEWSVTPKLSGQNSLKLIIKLKDINKDIVVFNKNIKIKSNVPVVVEGFFEKYWQWLMTTIIIPIFLYFWNRKKKRKQTKKS